MVIIAITIVFVSKTKDFTPCVGACRNHRRFSTHSTSISAYGMKRDLIYKNCFANNFLINNKRQEKSVTSLKVGVNFNGSNLRLAV